MGTYLISSFLSTSGFKLGSLPVSYLGVPLVARRFTDKDYRSLIAKITSRIDSCVARKLSYTGRLQLVQHVIYFMINFWCNNFILPKKVLRAVEQRCKVFL